MYKSLSKERATFLKSSGKMEIDVIGMDLPENWKGLQQYKQYSCEACYKHFRPHIMDIQCFTFLCVVHKNALVIADLKTTNKLEVYDSSIKEEMLEILVEKLEEIWNTVFIRPDSLIITTSLDMMPEILVYKGYKLSMDSSGEDYWTGEKKVR